MQELNNKKFNHLKIHTQYSICEGAVKIDNLKDYCKKNGCFFVDQFNNKDNIEAQKIMANEAKEYFKEYFKAQTESFLRILRLNKIYSILIKKECIG